MPTNILAPIQTIVGLAAAAVLIIIAAIFIVALIRSKSAIRGTMNKLSEIEDSLRERSAERKTETVAFVTEIKNVQKGETADTRAVSKLASENHSPLSAEGMAEENALTAALFPLYMQERAYPELYSNERVSAAAKSLRAADSAFESERQAYNEACAVLTRQTSTKSGRLVARMYKYSAPPPFPDP